MTSQAVTRTARVVPTPEITRELQRESPKGAFATFVPIAGTDRGIKLYSSREVRDQSYRNQRKLANKGIAPACDDCFETTDSFGRPMYGFWTVVAETLDRERYYGGDAEYWNKVQRDFEDLRRKVGSAGCDWLDDHYGNIGWIAGRPVIIDCADDLFGSGCIGLPFNG